MNEENPIFPYWIAFGNEADYQAAVQTIEQWDKDRNLPVVKIGENAPEADLTKPYTLYDNATLSILATADAVQVLDAAGIQYH